MTTISISISVPGDPFPGEKEVAGKLFPSWLIAVMAGAAGLFVLAILVLCLCCLKCRRKKAKRGKKTLIAYYLVSVLCSLFMILIVNPFIKFDWLERVYHKSRPLID